MPFQSEKQRRYLHANHPEIAKRWERDYANGGISNHFRRKIKGQPHMLAYITPNEANKLEALGGQETMTKEGIPAYPEWDSMYGASSKASFDAGQAPKGTWGGGGGGGHHPTGPTPAEIAAAKAAAAAAAQAAKLAAEKKAHKEWITKTKKDRTKKVKHLKNINKTKNWMWKGDKLGKNFYKNVSFDDALKMEKKWGYNPKYTGKGAINIGKNPNIIDKGIGFSKYLTKAISSPGANISGGTPLMRMGVMQPGTFSKGVLNLAGKTLGPISTAYTVGDLLAQRSEAMGEEADRISTLEGDDQTEAIEEYATKMYKPYAHGGILDISGDEESTTDDGNDIELTAFNAEFDDPNDLSTGVKTLFRAKNGGSYTMQGGVKNYLGDQETVSHVPIKWRSGPDSPPTELAYITKAEKDLLLKKDLHGSLKDGPNTGPEGLMSLDSQGDRGTYGDTGQGYGDRQTTDTSPEVGDRQSKADIEEYEKNREIREANQKAADDAKAARVKQSWEEQWGKWNDKYDKLNKYSYTGSGVKKRAKLTDQNYNEDRAALEKKFGKSLIMKIAMAFLGIPISIGFKDIKAVKSMYDLEKKYKADMQNLKDISIDKGWADFHHAVDTPMQTIDQLMMDTIRVKKDDDTSGEGPEVVPIHEEIQEYESMAANPMSLLNMRDNKALYAALSEKWEKQRREKEQQYTDYGLIPDNTAVGAVTMQANSGGLANLFRVKNQ